MLYFHNISQPRRKYQNLLLMQRKAFNFWEALCPCTEWRRRNDDRKLPCHTGTPFASCHELVRVRHSYRGGVLPFRLIPIRLIHDVRVRNRLGLGLGIGLGIGLWSGLGLGIGLGMGLGIGLGSGFEYFRKYNVIGRIGIRRNGTEP